MRIAIIGTGYVGLVSAACFARAGHHVSCVDIDASKISLLERGGVPIYEPGLQEIISNRSVRKRLTFTSDAAAAVSMSDIIFIAVGTPSRPSDGHADLSHVYAAVEAFSDALRPGAIVATKSTVPVGTGDAIGIMLADRRPDLDFEVASNPEFLRAGSAVNDFTRPDRVVVGAGSERAATALANLYRSVGVERARILRTDVRSAELIKYAANGFLATKIAYINEVSDLCEQVNASVADVARGIGLDHRIGAQYLQPGPGFGGSCFPKDARALAKIGEDHNAPMRIIETVLASNDARKRSMVRKIARTFGSSLRGKTIALLGLTFKADTDDMREAVSIPLAQGLVDAGCLLRAYDPVANDRARSILPCRVSYHGSPLEAAEKADAIVIVTEWREFRQLDLERLREVMKTHLIVDLRGVLTAKEVRLRGFQYVGLGGSSVHRGLDATAMSISNRESRTAAKNRTEDRAGTAIQITAAE